MPAEPDFEGFSGEENLAVNDSVMKTAWIRVSAVNHTGENKDEIVEYTKDGIAKELAEWSKTTHMDYYLNEHTPDEGDTNNHFHFAIRFYSPTRFSVIKNKFPFGKIQTAKSIPKSVQYLIHKNHPNKKQYDWSDVVTNADLTPFKVRSGSQQKVDMQRVFEKIESGEITPYNYQDTIPIDLYANNERLIQSAFTHHIASLASSIHRKIKVIYLCGKSRVGKSRLAYDLAKTLYPDEEPSNSSSSRDPLQDYKGQKVFIWNEFRDTHMKYSDLLSFIDPHYRSSGSSRYHDKPFLGEVIILTSTQSLDKLYQKVETTDNKAELKNRISEYHEFIEDNVRISLSDGNGGFRFLCYHLNPYYGMASNTFDENSKSFNSSVYEKMGIELVHTDCCDKKPDCVRYSEEWKSTDEGIKFFDMVRGYIGYSVHNNSSDSLFGVENALGKGSQTQLGNKTNLNN